NGFVNVVDALGGVPFCVPEPIEDRQAHVELEAGQQVLDGTEALGYARVRKSVGDGSDTDRIERQQDLLAATVRHALDQNLLTDGPALYGFLDAATSSVTASSNYGSISTLAGLAVSLRGLDPEDISFVTVPWAGLGDGVNVVWTHEAEELWASLAADEPLEVSADDENGAAADPDGTEDADGSDTGDGSDDIEDTTDDTDETSTDSGDSGPTLDGSTAQDSDQIC
ncbi:MAG TPA: LCP family protein, partial [Beutenbergiaceae bacterium]|nr:LCP family protein [Beutenbergiaceae bacterium]